MVLLVPVSVSLAVQDLPHPWRGELELAGERRVCLARSVSSVHLERLVAREASGFLPERAPGGVSRAKVDASPLRTSSPCPVLLRRTCGWPAGMAGVLVDLQSGSIEERQPALLGSLLRLRRPPTVSGFHRGDQTQLRPGVHVAHSRPPERPGELRRGRSRTVRRPPSKAASHDPYHRRHTQRRRSRHVARRTGQVCSARIAGAGNRGSQSRPFHGQNERSTVVGRENHYGSKSRRGTEVASIHDSLLETARLHGVNPTEYIVEAVRAGRRAEFILPW